MLPAEVSEHKKLDDDDHENDYEDEDYNVDNEDHFYDSFYGECCLL